jgi:hypothetical protein
MMTSATAIHPVTAKVQIRAIARAWRKAPFEAEVNRVTPHRGRWSLGRAQFAIAEKLAWLDLRGLCRVRAVS